MDKPLPIIRGVGEQSVPLTRPLQVLANVSCGWHSVRDGTLTRRGFEHKMKPVRDKVESLLLRGVFSGNESLRGNCTELYVGRANLWTFIDTFGIDPTNNDAERALHHAVIWGKLSFGTQIVSGSRFVDTMLTVIETCRQRNCNAFSYVTQAMKAHLAKTSIPLCGV